MPYIDVDRREELTEGGDSPQTTGELNFLITHQLEKYRLTGGDSYSTFNAILGAIESAKQEFYRRVVAPYEDEKQRKKGDVYR